MADVSPMFFLFALVAMFVGGRLSGRMSADCESCELRSIITKLLERELVQPPCLVCGAEGNPKILSRTFGVCPTCLPSTAPEIEKLRRETVAGERAC